MKIGVKRMKLLFCPLTSNNVVYDLPVATGLYTVRLCFVIRFCTLRCARGQALKFELPAKPGRSDPGRKKKGEFILWRLSRTDPSPPKGGEVEFARKIQGRVFRLVFGGRGGQINPPVRARATHGSFPMKLSATLLPVLSA